MEMTNFYLPGSGGSLKFRSEDYIASESDQDSSFEEEMKTDANFVLGFVGSKPGETHYGRALEEIKYDIDLEDDVSVLRPKSYNEIETANSKERKCDAQNQKRANIKKNKIRNCPKLCVQTQDFRRWGGPNRDGYPSNQKRNLWVQCSQKGHRKSKEISEYAAHKDEITAPKMTPEVCRWKLHEGVYSLRCKTPSH